MSIAVDNVAKVKDVITSTVESKAKLGAKREGKGSGSPLGSDLQGSEAGDHRHRELRASSTED